MVCPTSLVSNWRREAERFAPSLNVLAHQGNSRIGNITHIAEWAQDADLILTTYGVLQRDTELLASIRWRGVVLDEAQNIKNPDTQQAKAARKIQAPCRIALTGTPVENHVGDLWSIMDFLNPGLLGTREAFRKTFLLPIRNHNDQDTNARLQAMCAPFVLRRMKNDPELELNLPDKIERRVACTLTKEQATLYGAVIKDMQQRLQHAKGIERLGLVFQATTRLKQVCNHPAQLVEHQDGAIAGRSGKLTKLLELMDEAITDGQKSLVFTQYVRMGHLLRQELEKRTSHQGAVPARKRPSQRTRPDGGTVSERRQRTNLDRVSQSRRQRSEPHGRQPRLSLRIDGGTPLWRIRPLTARSALARPRTCKSTRWSAPAP